jgi:hypothetical protein
MYWNKQAWPADSTKPVKVTVIAVMKVEKKEKSKEDRRGHSQLSSKPLGLLVWDL